MRDLLDYIVKNLVSTPDAVVIEESSNEGGVQLNLTVAPDDMGMIIGKGGQTIRSIRRLITARAMAEGENLRVFVNLVEVGSPNTEIASSQSSE